MKELVKRPAQMLAMPLLLALAVIAVRPSPSLAGSATKWSAPMTVVADDWEQIPGDSDSGPSAPGSKPSADGVPSVDHPQRGPADAPVTIVEYSDYQCPYCSQAEGTLRQVLHDYGDQVRLVYMDFPLRNHAQAMGAAQAARCAGEQGHFWEYHDALLSAQARLSPYMLVNLAGQLGLDAASFGACVSEGRYQDAIRADMAAGARAGASGTPTFFVNGHPLRGAPSYAQFAATIERALKPGSEPTRIKTIDSV
jgi:protein-disulfide isomerase